MAIQVYPLILECKEVMTSPCTEDISLNLMSSENMEFMCWASSLIKAAMRPSLCVLFPMLRYASSLAAMCAMHEFDELNKLQPKVRATAYRAVEDLAFNS